jgi:hypothetical protein
VAALAQNGLTYCTDPFDKQRYSDLRTIAAEMLAAAAGIEAVPLLAVFLREEGVGNAEDRYSVGGV